MSKDRKEFFLKIPRQIFSEYNSLSWQARWLFVVLCEIESRYSGTKKDYFYRTQSDLSSDTGMNPATVRKYRRELESAGLIQAWKAHFTREGEKKSREHTIAFRVLL